MIDISYTIHILAILFLIIALSFTIFIVFNEYKLRETESSESLKKMYKKAFYLSISFLIIGLVFMGLGMVYGEDISAYMGWSLISGSIVAIIYSLINLYNISN